MSVLIKDMKMPESCVECLAVIRETLTDPIDRDTQMATVILRMGIVLNVD